MSSVPEDTRRLRALRIAMQLGVMSILTLITVAVFTHIATLIIFRRLIIGNPKAEDALPGTGADRHSALQDNASVISWREEFFVPIRSTIRRSTATAAAFEDQGLPVETEDQGIMHRAARGFVRFARKTWNAAGELPTTITQSLIRDSGVTREIFVRCYHHRAATEETRQALLLCNPSGETIDTISEKAIALSEASGFDSLVMFDYRPTGRSCRGLVAPDTKTMLEDAESVMQWLIAVKGIKPESISIAGISIGGLQAIRLAVHYPMTPRLLLINTFSSFTCLMGSTLSLVPGALRLGGTSAFLPDITHEIHALKTPAVAIVSVETDERIPTRCTEEMISAVSKAPGVGRIVHVIMKGTHSKPIIDHNSIEIIREFLDLPEPATSYNNAV